MTLFDLSSLPVTPLHVLMKIYSLNTMFYGQPGSQPQLELGPWELRAAHPWLETR